MNFAQDSVQVWVDLDNGTDTLFYTDITNSGPGAGSWFDEMNTTFNMSGTYDVKIRVKLASHTGSWMDSSTVTTTVVDSCSSSISIDHAGDTLGYGQDCRSTQGPLSFYFGGNVSGVDPSQDSVEVQVDFDDGTDTTFKTRISASSQYGGNWGSYVDKTYDQAGTYDVKIHASVGGITDSTKVTSTVISTCPSSDTLTIDHAYDTTYNEPCAKTSVPHGYYFGGIANGVDYTQDSVQVNVDFDDGTDTTFMADIIDAGPDAGKWYGYIEKTYTSSGTYNVTITAEVGGDQETKVVITAVLDDCSSANDSIDLVSTLIAGPYCREAPVELDVHFAGSAFGIDHTQDSVQMDLDFGDGTDTVVMVDIDQKGDWTGSVKKTYSQPGTYTITFQASLPRDSETRTRTTSVVSSCSPPDDLNITYADDTLFSEPCARTSIPHGYHFGGTASGVDFTQDSVEVNIDFDDGTDTTFMADITDSGPDAGTWSGYVEKTFTTAGSYDVKIHASVGGAQDVRTVSTFVVDNCPVPDLAMDYAMHDTASCHETGQDIEFVFGGTATGVDYSQDSVRIDIDFDDGTDTTFKVNITSGQYPGNWQGDLLRSYSQKGTYDVKIIASVNGEKDSSTVTTVVSDQCSLTTSIGKAPDKGMSMKLFPNPADQQLQLDLGAEATGTVTIRDMVGKVVHTESVNNATHRLNVSQLPSGLYTVSFHSEKDRTVLHERVMIERK